MKTKTLYALTALVFGLMVFRLFLGVDITDESQYAAQAYTLTLGVAPFEADLLIQQTAAILIQPLVQLYVYAFGTEGFVLFLRLLYFALAVLSGLVGFFYLRKHYDSRSAWIAASFLWLYVPCSLASWSYNTVSILLFPVSLFLLFGWGARVAFLGGLAGAVACFCYPTLGAVYALVVGYAWWQVYRGKWKRVWRVHLSFLVALGLGGAVSLTYMFGFVGFDKIAELFAFSKSFGELGGPEKFIDMANRFWDGLTRTLYIVFLPLLWYLHRKKGKQWFKKKRPVFVAFGLVLAGFSRLYEQRSLGWLVYACLLIFVLFWPRMAELRKKSDPRWIMLLASFFAAFIYAYSSGNGFIVAGFGLLLAVQLLLLEASEDFKAKAPQVLALVAAFFLFWNFYFIYRDQPFSQVPTQVQEGPFRFLLTTDKRRKIVEDVGREFAALSSKYKTLFAAYFAPAYLYTGMRPVTGMLYVHEAIWPPEQIAMILYRTLNKDEWPEILFVKRSEIPDFEYQFETIFLATGRYETLVEKEDYRIFKRKDLP